MSRRTIGRLAEETEVGVETIRFYERTGLLRRPPSPGTGWRTYGEDAVWTIRYIRLAQRLGFKLSEIRQLGRELKSRGNFCGNFRDALEDKLLQTNAELERLTAIQAELERTLSSCRAKSGRGECPITERFKPGGALPTPEPKGR